MSRFDWDRFNEERRARMSPEQLEKEAAYLAREARYDLTKETITGHFERLSDRAPPKFQLAIGRSPAHEAGRYIEKSWTKDLVVRIEDRPGGEGIETIAFNGAVTGYENYELREDFLDDLKKWRERDVENANRFYVCGGTVGLYDACWVDIDEVIAFLERHRPELGSAPSCGI